MTVGKLPLVLCDFNLRPKNGKEEKEEGDEQHNAHVHRPKQQPPSLSSFSLPSALP